MSKTDSNGKKTDERRIATDGGRDVPLGGEDNPGEPIIDSPPVGVNPDEPPKGSPPDARTLVRPQVTRDDDDENPTVTACMDCLDYFPSARESWERCPMCGSGLVAVEPAGDAA